MTYPTEKELSQMMKDSGAENSGMAISRVALRTGFSWEELNEIHAYGHVTPETASYWNMVREKSSA